jgi:uncharacterized membrane protein
MLKYELTIRQTYKRKEYKMFLAVVIGIIGAYFGIKAILTGHMIIGVVVLVVTIVVVGIAVGTSGGGGSGGGYEPPSIRTSDYPGKDQ